MTQSNIITVSADGTAKWRGTSYRCALGSAGVTSRKREGDHASPMGCFALRRVLFRPDREPAPDTLLPVVPLRPDSGWCDDPASASYNQPVSTRPVRSMLTKLHYENKTGIMKWIFKDILRLSALPKMVMVEALKLYENGQRVLGPYHYKQA